MSEARDVRARAAEWLERRVSEDWSESDQRALDAWLAESPTHRVAYMRVHAAWDKADRLAALNVSLPRKMTRAMPKRIVPLSFAIAASVAVIAAAGVFTANYLAGPREHTYSTDVGGRETLRFADGSLVELNTNTVLSVRLDAHTRVATLDRGEAYFQIKHDAAHPFAVTVAAHRVVDLGTKFLIRNNPDHVEVALLEGRARFDTTLAAGQRRSTLMTPGDVVTATAHSTSLTRKPVDALAGELAWRRGVLVFHQTTLSDAAAQFNRYNREKLVIGDSDTAKLKIDGTFPARDLEAFTDIAQDILHLHVAKRGNETVISR